MDIQKLTKKNQEFIHIATNQLIKDGKSDQEIKDILGDIIPELIENQKKANNLKLVNLTKKYQKQTKHLGKCGLIPHSSF